jgi:signal transduction histidine kinase
MLSPRSPSTSSSTLRDRFSHGWRTSIEYAFELHRLGVTIAATGTFLGLFVSVVVEGRPSGGQFLAMLLGVLAARVPEGRVWLLAVATIAPAWTSESVGAAVMVACLTYLGMVLTPSRHIWVPIVAAVSAGFAPFVDSSFYFNPLHCSFAAAIGLTLGWASRRVTHQQAQLRNRTERSESHALWLEQRTALARELHDVVGHHVTAMVIKAEAGQVAGPQTALTEIADLGRSALTELDSLVVHLRDPDAAASISAPPRLADIDPVLTAPLTGQGISVTVHLDPDLPLDEVGELAAYRIVQEGLTNVQRHAEARHAWVSVRRAGPHVRISVVDDGRGPGDGQGAGMAGIGERVDGLGGVWAFGPRPEGGSQLDAFIPIDSPGEVR